MNSLPCKSKPVQIYYLCDPRDDIPRYVGKAEVSLADRLSCHISESKQPARQHWHKSRWFRKLEREGIKPEIRLIELVPPEATWQDRERYWIKTYREMGYPLTNLTDGGEGTINRVYSEETRRKISESRKGKPSPQKGKPMRPEAYQNVLDACYKELPDHIMSQLGQLPDVRLAEQASVTRWLIKKRREEKGIPEFEDLSTPNGVNPKTWPQWALDKLGKVQDIDLSKELNVGNYIVRSMRASLNIPPLRDTFWTQDKIELLGTMPDYKLAEQLGVTTMTVNHRRRKLGITSYSKQRQLKNAS